MRAYECSMVVVARATMAAAVGVVQTTGTPAAAAAAVAREIKAIDIRRRQKRRKELKSQLTDLFSAGRGVPPELIQNILAFIGYDLVQAPVEAQVIVRGIAASIHNMMQSQHGAAVLAATAAAGAAAFDASGSFSGVNIAAFDAALAAYEDGSSDQVAVNAEVVNDESSVDEDWDDDVDDDAPALDQVDVGAHVGGPPDHVAANAEVVNARARERAMRHALRHAWAPGGMFRRLAEREWVDPAMALSRMESAWNPGGVYRMEVERYERSLP